VEDTYEKKELSERWSIIGKDRIQRDLYSSFLIMNVNPDLNSINRSLCVEKYERFKALHDQEIARLGALTKGRKVASMGI